MISPDFQDFLRNRISSGVRWLYRSQQPEDGILSHHGIYLNLKEVEEPGYGRVGVIPSGHSGYPVVVVEMPSILQNFSVREEKDLRGLIEEAVQPYTKVIKSWNGVGTNTVSYQLQRLASRQVLILTSNYHQGCPNPKHGVLCSWDGCRWYPDGYNKVKLPKGWS